MDSSAFGSPSSFGLPPAVSSLSRIVARPGSPLRANVSRRGSTSGRSSQYFQIICKTPYHLVESFGVAMPILVVEALTFCDASAAVSASISADGWAWFVCGRKLLVWKYKLNNAIDKKARSVSTNPCHELTLPPSDLAHKAELVSVFVREKSKVPSCIAVSPEGAVSYWPSVHHQNSVEANTELRGQECHSLTHLGPAGCILATTTSTLLLVEPQIKNGRHTVLRRLFRSSHGFLADLGQRVGHYLFGSSQAVETRLVKVVSRSVGLGQWSLYVLSDCSLQKWSLCAEKKECLLYECELKRLAREAFHETVLDSGMDPACDLDVWLMDMQPTDGGVMLLTAAAKKHASAQVYYALGRLETVVSNPPTKFCSFCPLNIKPSYRREAASEVQSYQFLLVGQTAYLFNDSAISVLSVKPEDRNPDVIEFFGTGDQLLGGFVCERVPVFFTKRFGLISISPTDILPHDLPTSLSMSDVPSTSDCTISQLSEYGFNIAITEAELNQFTYDTNAVVRLKAAFIHFVKSTRDPVMSRKILQEIFPFDESSSQQKINSLVDETVVKLAKVLIDDVPISDPRWKHCRESEFGYASLQISCQLEDKFRALELYYIFLKSMKVWERLGAFVERSDPMPTVYVLAELAEKMIAVISIWKLDHESAELRASTIKRIAEETGEPRGLLSDEDIFYRQVSAVEDFFNEMVSLVCYEVLCSCSFQDTVERVKICTKIVVSLLQDVMRYRQMKAEFFKPANPVDYEVCDNELWTIADGSHGLKDCLLKLVELNIKHAAPLCGNESERNEIYEQVVNVIDLYLDGRKCQVESLRDSSKFESAFLHYQRERYKIVKHLVDDEQYERAATLGEKYCDLDILILVCEKSVCADKLDVYMKQFASQDFGKYLFNHYIQEQKYGQLMELLMRKERPSEQIEELAEFLKTYPSLAWLLDIHSSRFKQAGDTLKLLAQNETSLLKRKKLQLCLSKMALLASGQPLTTMESDIAELNTQLGLISCEELLPDPVLASYDLDLSRLRVLSPAEVIKLYICDENLQATEEDFKRAIELLPFVDDEIERSELRHSVWCQAVLRDRWDALPGDRPKDMVHNTLFFKLVELLLFYDYQPDDFLPPVDRLLESPELEQLCKTDNFQYLLRLAYECIEDSGYATPS